MHLQSPAGAKASFSGPYLCPSSDNTQNWTYIEVMPLVRKG